jgi:hypothetical protein
MAGPAVDRYRRTVRPLAERFGTLVGLASVVGGQPAGEFLNRGRSWLFEGSIGWGPGEGFKGCPDERGDPAVEAWGHA